MEQAIEGYLDAHYSTGGYEIRHREAGCIPMAFLSPVDPGLLPIGANGGCVRPSSGYAFCFIQRQVDEISQHLATDGGGMSRARLPRPVRRLICSWIKFSCASSAATLNAPQIYLPE